LYWISHFELSFIHNLNILTSFTVKLDFRGSINVRDVLIAYTLPLYALPNTFSASYDPSVPS
jgi:hypothetical protein